MRVASLKPKSWKMESNNSFLLLISYPFLVFLMSVPKKRWVPPSFNKPKSL